MQSISRSISKGGTGSKKENLDYYSVKLQEEGGTRNTNFSPTEEEKLLEMFEISRGSFVIAPAGISPRRRNPKEALW